MSELPQQDLNPPHLSLEPSGLTEHLDFAFFVEGWFIFSLQSVILFTRQYLLWLLSPSCHAPPWISQDLASGVLHGPGGLSCSRSFAPWSVRSCPGTWHKLAALSTTLKEASESLSSFVIPLFYGHWGARLRLISSSPCPRDHLTDCCKMPCVNLKFTQLCVLPSCVFTSKSKGNIKWRAYGLFFYRTFGLFL